MCLSNGSAPVQAKHFLFFLLACLRLANVPGLCACVDVRINERRRKVCFQLDLCMSVCVNVALMCVCPMLRLLFKRSIFSVSVFAPCECSWSVCLRRRKD